MPSPKIQATVVEDEDDKFGDAALGGEESNTDPNGGGMVAALTERGWEGFCSQVKNGGRCRVKKVWI